MSRAHLYLSERYSKSGQYERALSHAKKSNLRGVDRTILLYEIYQGLGEEKKAKKVLDYIKDHTAKP